MNAIAAVSPHWEDARIIFGALAAVCAFAWGAARIARGVWRSWRNFTRRLRQAFDDVTETVHLVRHHLGPNGNTTPLHQRVHTLTICTADLNARMRVLETVHGVTDPAPLPEENP